MPNYLELDFSSPQHWSDWTDPFNLSRAKVFKTSTTSFKMWRCPGTRRHGFLRNVTSIGKSEQSQESAAKADILQYCAKYLC